MDKQEQKISGMTILNRACDREKFLIETLNFKWINESKYYLYSKPNNILSIGISMLDVLSLEDEEYNKRLKNIKSQWNELNRTI